MKWHHCKYCGARLKRDHIGQHCPTRNCQWHHGLPAKDDTTIMQTKLNRYNPDLVDQVRKNTDLARVDPRKLALRCKNLGVSSVNTYVRDIERSILNILALIDSENKA